MTLRIAPGLVLLPLAFALSACQPDPEPAPPQPPEPITAGAGSGHASGAAVAGTDAIAVVHHAPKDPAGFDRKDFAGTFSGILPCEDCPGIDTRLVIAADGRFQLAETRHEGDSTQETSGTWTVDDAGARLLLDPDTKDAGDRHFEVVSKDEIRMLDAAGNPAQGAHNLSLRR
ncbi:copper resistance protein NlpE [Luteimonas saliphila]|uniref:copper resistance protein NlpE n=1 Tax=Luteimonas saliphila TaxID=2804919 RepID=UPI00192D5294|nr:copper resistance protein NlpE [Luteimonas saliphila]